MKNKMNIIFRVGFLLGIAGATNAAEISPEAQQQAARDLIHRVTPSISERFRVELIPSANGKDVYELSSAGEEIVIKGNNGVSIASAYGRYLKEFCKVQYSIWGDQMALPKTLPKVPAKIRVVNPRKVRQFFNYCTFNYTATWWNWGRWQKMIDILAMHGVNMPLAIVGVEAVWYQSLLDVGFTDLEARSFITAPIYSSFQWMSVMDGTGGPLPKSYIDSHLKLGRQIMDRQMSLGMQPIVHGFSGHVPHLFKEKFPNAKVDIKKRGWSLGSFDGVAQLDPMDPLFERFGTIYLKNQIKLLGSAHYYMADPFHEGGAPVSGNEYLGNVGRRISELFTAVDPEAIWVMQTWSMKLPIIKAVSKDKLLIMNLAGDRWKRIPAGYEFTQGQLNSFGGRTHMHGDLKNLAQDLYTQTVAQSKYCVGVGNWTEGLNDNPVNYHLALDMNWTAGPIDIHDWLKSYAACRYGSDKPELAQAWELLLKGPYRRGGYDYPSIIAARPGLNPPKSDPNKNWKAKDYYDSRDLVKAWELLLTAVDDCKDSAGYRFDIADCGRQSMSNLAIIYQRRIANAFINKDRVALAEAGKQFTALLADLDELVSSCPEMLMGKWQADAMSWGTTEKEKAYYASNGVTLPTIWGSDKPDPKLYDYAWREWGGFVKTYYMKRWEIFIEELDKKLAAGEDYMDPQNIYWTRFPFRADDIHKKLADFEEAYVANPPAMSATAHGDTYAIAKRLLNKYKAEFQEMTPGYTEPILLKLKNDELGVAVSSWTRGTYNPTWKTVRFDVTSIIGSRGTYKVTFLYDGGRARLDMKNLRILENDVEVDKDIHEGKTGKTHEGNVFTLQLSRYSLGHKYELEATVRTDGNSDSNGKIWIKKTE